MNNQYVRHEQVTREVLDEVGTGDFVKCNNWIKPMKVVGVSKNYFVMIQKNFGQTYYSVCEKKQSDYTRNNYTKGQFRIGQDDYIFGSPCGYQWDNPEWVSSYLDEFEQGKTQLSVRTAVNLTNMSRKKARDNDDRP